MKLGKGVEERLVEGISSVLYAPTMLGAYASERGMAYLKSREREMAGNHNGAGRNSLAPARPRPSVERYACQWGFVILSTCTRC